MTEKTEEKTGGKAPDLTAEQTAVLQLVTITPAPRTEEELAASYAGLREANLWPEQSQEQVKNRLKELREKKLVKYGEKAPDDKPTVELTAKAEDD